MPSWSTSSARRTSPWVCSSRSWPTARRTSRRDGRRWAVASLRRTAPRARRSWSRSSRPSRSPTSSPTRRPTWPTATRMRSWRARSTQDQQALDSLRLLTASTRLRTDQLRRATLDTQAQVEALRSQPARGPPAARVAGAQDGEGARAPAGPDPCHRQEQEGGAAARSPADRRPSPGCAAASTTSSSRRSARPACRFGGGVPRGGGSGVFDLAHDGGYISQELQRLPRRHRHRWSCWHADPGGGSRRRRLHRLQPLGIPAFLHRRHRPRWWALDAVCPHAAALSGQRRVRACAGARSSATWATPVSAPARTSTGRSGRAATGRPSTLASCVPAPAHRASAAGAARIHRSEALADLPVDVGAARASGQADDPDDLATADTLTGPHPSRRHEVGVDGLVASGVSDDDDEGAPAAIPGIPADVGDISGCGCPHGRATPGRDVDAVVEAQTAATAVLAAGSNAGSRSPG